MEKKDTQETKALVNLKKLLVDGTITADIEYEGSVYTFANLTEEDEIWRDRFINMDTPLSMASSKRAPILSVALRAINGESVEKLVEIDAEGLTETEVKYAIAERLLIDYFRNMKRDHITNLYQKWVGEIAEPEVEAVKEVKNS